MRYLLGLIALLLTIGPAEAAVVQDRDGYTNGRGGPGESFPVKCKVQSGQHVLIFEWPDEYTRKELKNPEYRDKLKKLGDLERVIEWRWVVTLARRPKLLPGYAAD